MCSLSLGNSSTFSAAQRMELCSYIKHREDLSLACKPPSPSRAVEATKRAPVTCGCFGALTSKHSSPFLAAFPFARPEEGLRSPLLTSAAVSRRPGAKDLSCPPTPSFSAPGRRLGRCESTQGSWLPAPFVPQPRDGCTGSKWGRAQHGSPGAALPPGQCLHCLLAPPVLLSPLG